MDRENLDGTSRDELARLARRSPERAAARLAELSLREQAELVLSVPAHERLPLLLHAPRPMRLVRSLPDIDLYLTVRELGPVDALPLVGLASADQILHLVDLESWRGDRFDADRAGGWVAVLLEAGEPALRRFLRNADDDLLALLAQRWMRAERADLDESDPDRGGPGHTEIGHERGLVSPDGNYVLAPTIAEHAAAVRAIVQAFFRDQPERYERVLWSAASELPAELEEQALHWRQSRLEEHGFPPWEEALEVYAAPVERGASVPRAAPLDAEELAPRAALAVLSPADPLAVGLLDLDSEAAERVLRELVAVANRLLVAERADTGDPAAHREALQNAAGAIAIAHGARGIIEPPRVRALLERVPLIELFREGHARAVELQARSRALRERGWAALHPRALELLEPPIRARIEGLLRPRPLYFPGEQEQGRLRPHRSLAEIEETSAALEMAEIVGRLLTERLGVRLRDLLEADASHPPLFGTLLLTLLAWHATRGELRVDPLPAAVTADFLRTVASRRTAAPDAAERAVEALVRTLVERFGLSVREGALVRSFARAARERLAAECAALDPALPVDPRYVSCLLLERSPELDVR